MTYRRLYYAIESILSELTSMIINESNLPQPIIDCYTELQNLSEDLDLLVDRTALDEDQIILEITDIYQDMVDMYVEYLEIKSSQLDDVIY